MQKLAAAYVKARRSFGPALKDKTNPAFRSKYADLGACIDAVEDALLDNGLAITQETFEDGSGVTVETVLLHESGEERRFGKLHLPASKQDPQGYGSALTYARRYSICAAFGIAPEDDDGNGASHAKRNDDAERQRAQARSNWLADTFAAIDAAATGGELKHTVSEAIAIATSENDADAIAKIHARAEAKAAQAKPKAKKEEVPA